MAGKAPCHGLGLSRCAYYEFLRRVYRMPALEAWTYARSHRPPSLEVIRQAIIQQRSREEDNGR